MDSTNCKPTSMQPIPMEQVLDIYKKIIRELIASFELEEEMIEAEPLPASVG